ncbi:MAG: hypothetical protein JKX81_09925 [Arenicella sp.]|nr:hypothetical protein [Arenicella sp.]
MTTNSNFVRFSTRARLNAISSFSVLSLLVCSSVHAITLDGQLDEPEWQDAKVISDFTTVSPYSLSEPEFATEVRLISNQKGIYIGFKNTQPMSTHSTELTARDSDLSADSNQVIIDYNASGLAAYGFEVGNGGSIKDGIWRDENEFSNDWDGSWQARTSQDQGHWYSEVYLPWSMVAMAGGTDSDQYVRGIKIYLSRHVKQLGVSYSNVPASPNRQRFISDFAKLNIDSFNQSSIQTFGYISAKQDTLNNDTQGDIGADLFWKSSNGKQLSVTVNPDFGQVESDGLVVNFTPNEVFFSERRPFFTQNQALFDVQGPENLRVIHTRRIGSQPDRGADPFSDITGAVKFTDSKQRLNYGIFVASEGDASEARGRDYYAGRILHTTDNYDLGFTSTFVTRPDLNRDASINAIDYTHRWGKTVQLKTQVLHSSVDVDLDDRNTKSDSAAWLTVEHQISKNNSQALSISHFGDDFDINDLGFLPRANLDALDYEYNYRNSTFSENSRVNSHEVALLSELQYNHGGDHLSTNIQFSDEWNFKDTSAFFWRIKGYSAGMDDRITRGNNQLNTKSGYDFQTTWVAQNTRKLRGHGHINWSDTFIGGKGFRLHLHPSYQFTDRYSSTLGLTYTQTDSWVNWISGNRLGSYDRKQAQASLDFDAKLSENQELRIKFEWIGFSADALNGLTVLPRGDAKRSSDSVDSFSFSTTALQVRYRYELAPLSNLFVVYSRGGNTNLDDTEGFGNLFSQSWENRNSSNIFVKLRYQF